MSRDMVVPPRGLPQANTAKHPTTPKMALSNEALRLRKPDLYGCILYTVNSRLFNATSVAREFQKMCPERRASQ